MTDDVFVCYKKLSTNRIDSIDMSMEQYSLNGNIAIQGVEPCHTTAYHFAINSLIISNSNSYTLYF